MRPLLMRLILSANATMRLAEPLNIEDRSAIVVPERFSQYQGHIAACEVRHHDGGFSKAIKWLINISSVASLQDRMTSRMNALVVIGFVHESAKTGVCVSKTRIPSMPASRRS